MHMPNGQVGLRRRAEHASKRLAVRIFLDDGERDAGGCTPNTDVLAEGILQVNPRMRWKSLRDSLGDHRVATPLQVYGSGVREKTSRLPRRIIIGSNDLSSRNDGAEMVDALRSEYWSRVDSTRVDEAVPLFESMGAFSVNVFVRKDCSDLRYGITHRILSLGYDSSPGANGNTKVSNSPTSHRPGGRARRKWSRPGSEGIDVSMRRFFRSHARRLSRRKGNLENI